MNASVENALRTLLADKLAECTEEQRSLFCRLYPGGVAGVPQERLDNAIRLCDRTIKKNKEGREETDMEAKHTPGRLHTHDNHLHLARERDGEVQLHYCLAVGTVSGTIGVVQASADMAHLAACWNACEGINPQAVPELLEACKIALENMLPCNPQWPPFDELDECPAGDEHECGACYNRRLVAAAIEKAQPK